MPQAEEVMSVEGVIMDAMLEAGMDARMAFRTTTMGELVTAVYTAMRRAELDAQLQEINTHAASAEAWS